MSALWPVLGYDRAADDIARALRDGDQINVLEGPPGVGKSWLAKDIGALWQAGGGSTILIEGDVLRADASLYPFAFAMGGLPSRWTTIGPAVAGVARAGETLVGTAGLLTTTVQALASVRRKRQRDRMMFLGDGEQVVLHDLERLGKKRPLLLIADNFHWWDASSLALLGRLRDRRMWDAFPFLSELRVLAVQTPEPYQSVAHPIAHDEVLSPSATRAFPLPRVPREGFEDVLRALGADPPPAREVTDVIHSLSGGHLTLAARCADRIATGEADVFLSAPDSEAFVRTLLTERMRALGVQGKQAMLVLQVAAVLGSTFRRDEVCCAMEISERETLKLMRYCRGEGVIEVADGLDRFVHDIYRQYFLSYGSADLAALYEKLSDCLRRTRSSEYELRCLNAVNADQQTEAACLAVHAALLAEREGRPWTNLPSTIVDALDINGMRAITERLVEALHQLRASCFAECLATLDRLPRRLPRSLAAEADFMRAMCLMSTRNERDRANGRLLLEGWSGYVEEEPEIGTRLMLLLLYGLFHVSDKQPGWALEAQINRSLSARAGFDQAAEDALYTLDRCAGGLHPPDAALVRVREAATHFGPRADQSVLRRPVEYYRCLVNLGAKLVENALYDEACAVCADVEELVGRYDAGVFARLDFAFGNQVLAEYRAGRIDAATAVERQRRVVERHEPDDDPFFAQSALAVYLALDGRHDEALAILDHLDAERLGHGGDPEPSMVYIIRANRCAVRYVAGGAFDVRAEWTALLDVAAANNYTDRDILVRRHQMVTDVLANGPALTALQFDNCLLDRHPERLGPLWRNFGHGFVLPALELWREN